MSRWGAAGSAIPPFANALAEHLVHQGIGVDAEASPRRRRRGPKVKTTPASSPLVERNRQAQRAHRHRKETYIKELEFEVSRLRHLCANITRERDSLAAQNPTIPARLGDSDVQRHSGIPTLNQESSLDCRAGHLAATPSTDSCNAHQSQSTTSYSSFESTDTQYSWDTEACSDQHALDYDAIGIDFVSTCVIHKSSPIRNKQTTLAGRLHISQTDRADRHRSLEHPCLQHIPFLVARSQDPTGNTLQHPEDVPDDDINLEISGHALMVSCPSPEQDLLQISKEEHGFPCMSAPSLASLYGLSDQIFDLSKGELPPIKAWAAIKQDPRFPFFQLHHFKQLRDELYAHVVCPRFGAVIPVDKLDIALRNLDLT